MNSTNQKTKICSNCDIDKSLKDYKSRVRKDGSIYYRQKCKKCEARLWYWNNHEVNIKKSKQYYQDHREERIAKKKKWYQKNRELIIKKMIEWQRGYRKTEKGKSVQSNYRENNREKLRRQGRKYYQKNKNCLIAKKIQWAKENPDRTYQIQKRYSQTEAGKAVQNASRHKRRVQILNNLSNVSLITSENIRIMMRNAKRCPLCNYSFNKNRIKTLDHIVPLSKGGSHTFYNCHIVCKSCNSRKQIQDISLFNGGQFVMGLQ